MNLNPSIVTPPPPLLAPALESPASLELAFVEAKSVWPRIRLSYAQFHAHVAQLGSANLEIPAYPADVYLCTACLDGQEVAYRSLEATYFPSLRAAIHHMVSDKPAVDDVLQEVRTRLFVGRSPKIATYRGSGSLGGWLRRVAARASSDHHRERAVQRCRLRKFIVANRTLELPALAVDEQSFNDERSRVCNQVWARAISALPSNDRKLLHHYFVSGLSIDTLSPLYTVHRATVARRIHRSVARIRAEVRKVLAAQHRELSGHELDTVVLESCRELDLSRALAPAGEEVS